MNQNAKAINDGCYMKKCLYKKYLIKSLENKTKQNGLAKFESLIFKINLEAVSSKVNS